MDPAAGARCVKQIGDRAGEEPRQTIVSCCGRPIQHRLASVTIVDSLAVRADGLATALMVLGPDEGLALAERTSVAALLLVRRAEGGFEERMSSRFRALLARTQ